MSGILRTKRPRFVCHVVPMRAGTHAGLHTCALVSPTCVMMGK